MVNTDTCNVIFKEFVVTLELSSLLGFLCYKSKSFKSCSLSHVLQVFL